MYEAVLAAIVSATEEGSGSGLTDQELQARVFVAAFNAAIKAPEEEGIPATGGDPNVTTDQEQGS